MTYNSKGYPNFSPFSASSVEIKFAGKRSTDFRLGNKAAGYKETPADHTWHHVEDMKTMQLVQRDVHEAFPHTGGHSLNRKR